MVVIDPALRSQGHIRLKRQARLLCHLMGCRVGSLDAATLRSSTLRVPDTARGLSDAVEVSRRLEAGSAHSRKLLDAPHGFGASLIKQSTSRLGDGQAHFLEVSIIIDTVHRLLIVLDLFKVYLGTFSEHSAFLQRFSETSAEFIVALTCSSVRT